MPQTQQDAPLRLLHLSDIHFRDQTQWDADPVLRALTRHLEHEVHDQGLAPDLVVITGDLAFSGKETEYDLARAWLGNHLWPLLHDPDGDPLERDRLLLVPGNHDVDRALIKPAIQRQQRDLLKTATQRAIAELLEDAEERERLLRRHRDYLAFHARWLGRPPSENLPWWQRTLDIRGQELHVAGLDTAWLAGGDSDRGKLLLGRYQLNQCLQVPEAEHADWRLALMHHPWDYFAEFDQHEARQAIGLHRDLLLRGHLHATQSQLIAPPDPKRACVELAAGALYERSSHANAYQWIELGLQPKRLRVHFRIWNQGEWTIDRMQPGCPDGIYQLDLPQPEGPKRPKPPVDRSPKVPAAYLTWLERRCSGVELLGPEARDGHAITLRHVYVPALTPTTRAPERGQPTADARLDHDEPRTIALLQRLDSDSLYCPAPPGAGKTTFCRWAALQAIPSFAHDPAVAAPEDYQESPPTDLRGRLPLLIPLREFSRTMDCGRGRREWLRGELEQALAAWIDQAPPDGLSGKLLLRHLSHGSAFLLLDGLDEVPASATGQAVTIYPRALLLTGLADALPGWIERGNRLLLTSRPYGLSEAERAALALPSAPIEPLPEPLQDLFAQRWFHNLEHPAVADSLITDLQQRPDVRELAGNPLLLKAMCLIYGDQKRLPEDKYRLYELMIGNVLDTRYERDAHDRAPVRAALEAVALGMHLGPDGDRETPRAEASAAEIEQHLARFLRTNQVYAHDCLRSALQYEELITRSGLLLPRGEQSAEFHHLSIQELLAAERLHRTSDSTDDIEALFRRRAGTPQWHVTLLFLFAKQAFGLRDPQWGPSLLGRLTADLDRAQVQANPAMALLIAEAMELCRLKRFAIPDALARSFRTLCLQAIDDQIEIKARHALGLCLGHLGDPRIQDLRDPAAYAKVPAGDYVYGKDKKPLLIEQPFLLSRYPVTNSQYAAFIDAGGYREREFWSDEGWAWLQDCGATEPGLRHNRAWNNPSQPVVGVSFWEAEACCRWAGGRLPTEREWEAAARGTSGLEYPWGNSWQNGICNSREAAIGLTSAVGIFPSARQTSLPLDDLAGNVWDWCSTRLYEGDAIRVLRGGTFLRGRLDLRWSGKKGTNPWERRSEIGFRCVLHARATRRLG